MLSHSDTFTRIYIHPVKEASKSDIVSHRQVVILVFLFQFAWPTSLPLAVPAAVCLWFGWDMILMPRGHFRQSEMYNFFMPINDKNSFGFCCRHIWGVPLQPAQMTLCKRVCTFLLRSHFHWQRKHNNLKSYLFTTVYLHEWLIMERFIKFSRYLIKNIYIKELEAPLYHTLKKHKAAFASVILHVFVPSLCLWRQTEHQTSCSTTNKG